MEAKHNYILFPKAKDYSNLRSIAAERGADNAHNLKRQGGYEQKLKRRSDSRRKHAGTPGRNAMNIDRAHKTQSTVSDFMDH